MTLSFNKLNEIAAIYESIADSEQEQLDESYLEELTAAQRNTKIKFESTSAFRTHKRFNEIGRKKGGGRATPNFPIASDTAPMCTFMYAYINKHKSINK